MSDTVNQQNQVVPNTIREFAADMINQYDRIKGEGKTSQEIVAFAIGFFNGLINGSVAILKDVDQKAVIQGFSCILADIIKKLAESGKSPDDILLCLKYYLIGTVDGIDFSAGKPVASNIH